MPDQISPREFHAAEGTEDWRVVAEGAVAFFRTDSFSASARLVAAMDAIEDIGAHPPAVDIRHEGVTVRLITATDDYMGMTTLELEQARLISTAATWIFPLASFFKGEAEGALAKAPRLSRKAANKIELAKRMERPFAGRDRIMETSREFACYDLDEVTKRGPW